MVEWSITAVLKTAAPRGTGGSNPSLSAKSNVTSLMVTSDVTLLFCVDKYLRHVRPISSRFLAHKWVIEPRLMGGYAPFSPLYAAL